MTVKRLNSSSLISSRGVTLTTEQPSALMDMEVVYRPVGSALISVGRHGVSTESGSDRVSLISKIRIANNVYPVATALGTDLITKLGHYCPVRRFDTKVLNHV